MQDLKRTYLRLFSIIAPIAAVLSVFLSACGGQDQPRFDEKANVTLKKNVEVLGPKLTEKAIVDSKTVTFEKLASDGLSDRFAVGDIIVIKRDPGYWLRIQSKRVLSDGRLQLGVKDVPSYKVVENGTIQFKIGSRGVRTTKIKGFATRQQGLAVTPSSFSIDFSNSDSDNASKFNVDRNDFSLSLTDGRLNLNYWLIVEVGIKDGLTGMELERMEARIDSGSRFDATIETEQTNGPDGSVTREWKPLFNAVSPSQAQDTAPEYLEFNIGPKTFRIAPRIHLKYDWSGQNSGSFVGNINTVFEDIKVGFKKEASKWTPDKVPWSRIGAQQQNRSIKLEQGEVSGEATGGEGMSLELDMGMWIGFSLVERSAVYEKFKLKGTTYQGKIFIGYYDIVYSQIWPFQGEYTASVDIGDKGKNEDNNCAYKLRLDATSLGWLPKDFSCGSQGNGKNYTTHSQSCVGSPLELYADETRQRTRPLRSATVTKKVNEQEKVVEKCKPKNLPSCQSPADCRTNAFDKCIDSSNINTCNCVEQMCLGTGPIKQEGVDTSDDYTVYAFLKWTPPQGAGEVDLNLSTKFDGTPANQLPNDHIWIEKRSPGGAGSINQNFTEVGAVRIPRSARSAGNIDTEKHFDFQIFKTSPDNKDFKSNVAYSLTIYLVKEEQIEGLKTIEGTIPPDQSSDTVTYEFFPGRLECTKTSDCKNSTDRCVSSGSNICECKQGICRQCSSDQDCSQVMSDIPICEEAEDDEECVACSRGICIKENLDEDE